MFLCHESMKLLQRSAERWRQHENRDDRHQYLSTIASYCMTALQALRPNQTEPITRMIAPVLTNMVMLNACNLPSTTSTM
jgi:hypothetical protein